MWEMYELENHLIENLEMLTAFHVSVLTRDHTTTTKNLSGQALSDATAQILKLSQLYLGLSEDEKLAHSRKLIFKTVDSLFNATRKQLTEYYLNALNELSIPSQDVCFTISCLPTSAVHEFDCLTGSI